MTTPDEELAAAELAAAEAKRERARLKKIAGSLGWKLIGGGSVEIKVEREILAGARTVVVRGRVSVPRPDEMTAAAGDRAA
ncbi:MAG: hypothetical protein IAI49_16510, partial [Candidatus Eremiobacteraeota bacterium]|nr:hypothetical protein [Candidatus Eremiobacteraeota bacterium]